MKDGYYETKLLKKFGFDVINTRPIFRTQYVRIFEIHSSFLGIEQCVPDSAIEAAFMIAV